MGRPASSPERTLALLRAQQEAALDGILVIDESRHVVSFNRRFLEVWKIDPELAATADDDTLIGAVATLLTDVAAFRERVAYLYEHPLETSRDELVLTDGRNLDRYSAPLIGDNGDNFGRIWFFRDTTDQRKAERDAAAFQQLGQYRLEEKIGEGGMGIVYRASHMLLRRPTAVKLLNPEKTTEQALRRFEREVQRTSQLTHPNTIIVFDYGRSSTGEFYYAMEYLDGINLAQLVEAYGPLPPGRVVRILEQACGALAEAHALSLIHRDIKPANIMLTERVQAPDFVKVLDFGLVKDVNPDVEGEPSFDTRLMDDGTISGTPRFMAPEGISEPEHVDTRSDIYALGALAYFLLTGKPIFETKVLALLLAEVLHTTPPPPSKRSKKPVPADLEAIVMGCLEKSPDDRPASAIALRESLLACACRTEWTDVHATAWWATHRTSPRIAASAVPVEPSAPKRTVPPGPVGTKDTFVGIDWRTRTGDGR